MLKIAIENSYLTKASGKDVVGAQKFMQEVFKQHGIQLVRTSINRFNNDKNCFTEYCTYSSSGDMEIIKKKFRPDIIWSRMNVAIHHKHESLKKFTIVPSQKVALISNDKYECYMFLKKYQPRTFLMSSFLRGKRIQDSFEDKFIIKPIRASGGKGIELTTTGKIMKQKEKYEGLDELYIVQEFMDFSQGYKGISDGIHDIRFMFAGKQIIEITLRTPKKGNFKSNIGSGGSQIPLQVSQIPKSLLNLTKKIYKELELNGDDIFSMDFAYCAREKKRYLIEINASPGTWYYQPNKKFLKPIFMGLIKFFTTL